MRANRLAAWPRERRVAATRGNRGQRPSAVPAPRSRHCDSPVVGEVVGCSELGANARTSPGRLGYRRQSPVGRPESIEVANVQRLHDPQHNFVADGAP